MVTVASGLTVTAGGLLVSAGSATITTTTSGGGTSASALVVSASESSYEGKVLRVSTATGGVANFFLFEVRARGRCAQHRVACRLAQAWLLAVWLRVAPCVR